MPKYRVVLNDPKDPYNPDTLFACYVEHPDEFPADQFGNAELTPRQFNAIMKEVHALLDVKVRLSADI